LKSTLPTTNTTPRAQRLVVNRDNKLDSSQAPEQFFRPPSIRYEYEDGVSRLVFSLLLLL
jgi:hypothetical protein